jgi:four helix bundle protein
LTPKTSPIFTKTEQFLLWLLHHTEKFPKKERFRLAKRIEDAAFNFHTYLLQAAQEEDTWQNLHLAGIELNKMRTYLRLSMETEYTSYDQYAYITRQLTEIGNLLGGWRKKAGKIEG